MTITAADITARIARNLRRAREEAGLSQDQLADLLGPSVRRNEIRRWEHGLHRPREERLLEVACIVHRDIAWFYVDHEQVMA